MWAEQSWLEYLSPSHCSSGLWFSGDDILCEPPKIFIFASGCRETRLYLGVYMYTQCAQHMSCAEQTLSVLMQSLGFFVVCVCLLCTIVELLPQSQTLHAERERHQHTMKFGCVMLNFMNTHEKNVSNMSSRICSFWLIFLAAVLRVLHRTGMMCFTHTVHGHKQ